MIIVFFPILVALLYVCSIYIWRITPWNSKDRYDNSEILRRTLSCGVSTIISWLFYSVYFLGTSLFQGESLVGFIGAILWVVTLFNGSIIYGMLIGFPCVPWNTNIQKFRVYVASPFFEEICFRVIICGFLNKSGLDFWLTFLIMATLFALCHLHDFIELFPFPHVSTKNIPSAIQTFIVTFVFSYLSFVIYLSTGSLLGTIVAHSIANYLQTPSLDYNDSNHKLYNIRIMLTFQHVVGLILSFVVLPYVFL